MAELDILHSVARQYRAALTMLRQAIDKCPESLWLAPEYLNRYWHIAYHSVFYTYFYLQPGEADFRAWTNHVPNSQYLSSRPGAPKVETPYTKSEVIELHFYNIRHLQHHTGQLADRLRTAINIGVPWVRPD
jgi:hypothetical protein